MTITIGKYKPLKKAFTLAIFCCIVLAFIYGFVYLFDYTIGKLPEYKWIGGLFRTLLITFPLIFISLIGFGYIYYLKRYSKFSSTIDDEYLTISKNIGSEEGKKIHLSEVKDLAIYQGNLDSILHLNNVFVTATNDTKNITVHLDGITNESAEQIQNAILKSHPENHNTKVITEKDYPNQNTWIYGLILKSLIVISLTMLVLLSGFYKYQNLNSYIYYVKLHNNLNYALATAIVILGIPIFAIVAIFGKKGFHFALKDGYLEIQSGNFIKRYIAYTMINNISLKQGGLDMILGVYTVKLTSTLRDYLDEEEYKTSGYNSGGNISLGAGLSGKNILIPGLKYQDAIALKEELLKKLPQKNRTSQ